MKRYATYRPTDIAWLPQIPEQWHTQRIKTLFRLRDERSYKPLSDVNLISVYAKMGVLQHKDIEHTTGNRAHNADGYKIVYPNDIIVNILLCWMGAIGHSEYQGVTSPAYDVYTPIISLNSKYYSYLFRTPLFSQQCYRVGKGIMAMRWRTYSPQFSNIPVPLPPRDEQDQIVRFLDWKIARINKLIHDKRHQITQLEEMKKVCIKDAVTGKLSDAKNFKASGFEFIGQVPSHWMIIEIRRAYSVILGKMLASHPTSSQDTLEEYVCAKDVHFEGVALNELKQMWFSPLEKKQYQIQNGDLLVVEGGAGAGNAAIVKLQSEKTIYVQNSIHIVRPKNEKATNAFLCYWISSIVSRGYMKYVCSVATIPHYTKDKVLSTMMPLPPKSEQIQIVDYLDDICDKIDKATNIIKKQITELNDLKTHLISDVVTGKIDVRDIEIPEYESVEDVLDENTEDAEEEEMTAVEEE